MQEIIISWLLLVSLFCITGIMYKNSKQLEKLSRSIDRCRYDIHAVEEQVASKEVANSFSRYDLSRDLIAIKIELDILGRRLNK